MTSNLYTVTTIYQFVDFNNKLACDAIIIFLLPFKALPRNCLAAFFLSIQKVIAHWLVHQTIASWNALNNNLQSEIQLNAVYSASIII